MTELEKVGAGRPQSLKTQELILKLQTRVKELEASNTDFEEMKKTSEIIRLLMRAMKGENADDDIYYGLIDQDRIEERTRLDDAEAVAHTAMRTAAVKWPIFSLMGALADEEDHYYISGDNETGGLGRREAILMRQAQTKAEGNMILNMPNPSGGVAQTDQAQVTTQTKKKSLIQRIMHR